MENQENIQLRFLNEIDPKVIDEVKANLYEALEKLLEVSRIIAEVEKKL